MRRIFFSGLFLFLVFAVSGSGEDSLLVMKAEKIHREVVTIDSHNDTPLWMVHQGFDMAERHDPLKERSKVDFPRMKEGGLDAAFFAVFVSQGPRDPAGYIKAGKRAVQLFDTIDAVLHRYPGLAALALTPADAVRLKKEGKRAVFIGIENGYVIGQDRSLIKTYFNRGARYITLCHTKNNDICDSSTDTVGFNGLSDFGREVVMDMNRVGMIVDVSHISDKSFFDVLALSKAPVIASHSCARALCNNPRNLSDSMLVALGAKHGVIQMCILSDYVMTPTPNAARDSARAAVRVKFKGFDNLTEAEMKIARAEWYALEEKYPQKLATVSDVVDHIDHIVKVAGIDCVGIGTDFDGGGGVTGCFDVSEMGNITLELVRRGYSRESIRKIWGGNLMRVMKEVERYARKQRRKPCNC
jgi:membrane dipeptidase